MRNNYILTQNAVSGKDYSDINVLGIQALSTNAEQVTIEKNGSNTKYSAGSLLLGHEYSMSFDKIYFSNKDSFTIIYKNKKRFLNEIINTGI